mgnify:CR=1 FL=1
MKNHITRASYLACVTLVVTALSMCLTPKAWAVDAEALFEARCSTCHATVKGLVKAELFVDNGALCGRGCGYDIRQFLPTHHGHPNAQETQALYELFYAQVKDEALDLIKSRGGFKTRCAICHADEAELARRYLVRDGDVVRGRYSGRDLKAFLATHGRINAAELEFFVNLLTPLAPTR